MYITREEWKKAFGMPTTPYDRLVGFECGQEYYSEFMRLTSNLDDAIKSYATTSSLSNDVTTNKESKSWANTNT